MEKPMGWSYAIVRAPKRGFKYGIFGGSLKLDLTGTHTWGFREWFFRIPLLGTAITVTKVSNDYPR